MNKKFTTKPVSIVPDLNRKIRIEINTSDFATGGVLSMEYEDKEMLVVIRGLGA